MIWHISLIKYILLISIEKNSPEISFKDILNLPYNYNNLNPFNVDTINKKLLHFFLYMLKYSNYCIKCLNILNHNKTLTVKNIIYFTVLQHINFYHNQHWFCRKCCSLCFLRVSLLEYDAVHMSQGNLRFAP